MKINTQTLIFTTIAFLVLSLRVAKCQRIDTLVNVGSYRLHFNILKGEGMPILFENGSGADGTMWDTILKPLSDITHATLITYDRAGFGKSELDTTNDEIDKHGIINGMQGLETGLAKLGYHGNMMLVASSFGGFYAVLYAARHPVNVKAMVGVDMNHVSWFTDSFVNAEMTERRKNAASIKSTNLAYYYQALNLRTIVDLLRKTPFPAAIPAIDLVSAYNFPDSVYAARWKVSHQQFAAARPNRESITATECGHVIFRDNPLIVVGAIVKAYTATMTESAAGYDIGKRFVTYSIGASNDQKRAEVAFRHSAEDLVSWGTALLQKDSTIKALEIFKLNVLLHKDDAYAYEKLGEAYEQAGKKGAAIENFRQSLLLKPDNANIKSRLQKLLP